MSAKYEYKSSYQKGVDFVKPSKPIGFNAYVQLASQLGYVENKDLKSNFSGTNYVKVSSSSDILQALQTPSSGSGSGSTFTPTTTTTTTTPPKTSNSSFTPDADLLSAYKSTHPPSSGESKRSDTTSSPLPTKPQTQTQPQAPSSTSTQTQTGSQSTTPIQTQSGTSTQTPSTSTQKTSTDNTLWPVFAWFHHPQDGFDTRNAAKDYINNALNDLTKYDKPSKTGMSDALKTAVFDPTYFKSIYSRYLGISLNSKKVTVVRINNIDGKSNSSPYHATGSDVYLSFPVIDKDISDIRKLESKKVASVVYEKIKYQAKAELGSQTFVTPLHTAMLVNICNVYCPVSLDETTKQDKNEMKRHQYVNEFFKVMVQYFIGKKQTVNVTDLSEFKKHFEEKSAKLDVGKIRGYHLIETAAILQSRMSSSQVISEKKNVQRYQKYTELSQVFFDGLNAYWRNVDKLLRIGPDHRYENFVNLFFKPAENRPILSSAYILEFKVQLDKDIYLEFRGQNIQTVDFRNVKPEEKKETKESKDIPPPNPSSAHSGMASHWNSELEATAQRLKQEVKQVSPTSQELNQLFQDLKSEYDSADDDERLIQENALVNTQTLDHWIQKNLVPGQAVEYLNEDMNRVPGQIFLYIPLTRFAFVKITNTATSMASLELVPLERIRPLGDAPKVKVPVESLLYVIYDHVSQDEVYEYVLTQMKQSIIAIIDDMDLDFSSESVPIEDLYDQLIDDWNSTKRDALGELVPFMMESFHNRTKATEQGRDWYRLFVKESDETSLATSYARFLTDIPETMAQQVEDTYLYAKNQPLFSYAMTHLQPESQVEIVWGDLQGSGSSSDDVRPWTRTVVKIHSMLGQEDEDNPTVYDPRTFEIQVRYDDGTLETLPAVAISQWLDPTEYLSADQISDFTQDLLSLSAQALSIADQTPGASLKNIMDSSLFNQDLMQFQALLKQMQPGTLIQFAHPSTTMILQGEIIENENANAYDEKSRMVTVRLISTDRTESTTAIAFSKEYAVPVVAITEWIQPLMNDADEYANQVAAALLFDFVLQARSLYSGGIKENSEHSASKSAKSKAKFAKVMREYYNGTLHSGSKHGPLVTKVDQAKAIAGSESRKVG